MQNWRNRLAQLARAHAARAVLRALLVTLSAAYSPSRAEDSSLLAANAFLDQAKARLAAGNTDSARTSIEQALAMFRTLAQLDPKDGQARHWLRAV